MCRSVSTSLFLGQLHHLPLQSVARCTDLWTLLPGPLPCCQAPLPLLDLDRLLLAPLELNGQQLQTERHARSGIVQHISRAFHVATGTF